MKNYYAMSTMDANETVVWENDTTKVVTSNKVTLLFWYDVYTLLAKQDAKVDKTEINGKWYKLTDSICVDLTNPNAKVKRLAAFNETHLEFSDYDNNPMNGNVGVNYQQ